MGQVTKNGPMDNSAQYHVMQRQAPQFRAILLGPAISTSPK